MLEWFLDSGTGFGVCCVVTWGFEVCNDGRG
jgi:hypothetical protein